MPKISIIVPVYNVEKFLNESMDSVKNQTLTDFECICVNDGSTDNSLEILKNYAKKDSRFKVISQENQGQGVARNKAIDLATGEYIVFLDPDDYIELNMLEVLYSTFLKTNAQVIQFDYITFNERNHKKRLVTFSRQSKKGLGHKVKPNTFFSWRDFKSKKLLAEIPLAAWNKAYSTKFIKENNIKLAPNKHGEDHIFSLGAILLADKVFYLGEALYNYRQNAGSSGNRVSDDNFAIFDNIQYLKEFLQKHNLYNTLEDEFEEYARIVMGWHYTCIPKESTERYIEQCLQSLSPAGKEKFLSKLMSKDKTFIEKIFSVKNWKQHGQKKKILTILGSEFVIKTSKDKQIGL